jgi:hypothetical protein
MLKIIFKNKKYYFNIFLIKKYFKTQQADNNTAVKSYLLISSPWVF